MKMNVVYILAACSLFVGAPAAAGPQDGDGYRGHAERPGFAGTHVPDPAKMLKRLERMLDLDEQQRQELENVLTSATPAIESLGARAREYGARITALDPADSHYTSELQSLATMAGELATEAVLLRGTVLADIHAHLTPEQRAVLAEKLELRHSRRGRHRAPGS